jgi:cell wall-associated NlpC family hydrolase
VIVGTTIGLVAPVVWAGPVSAAPRDLQQVRIQVMDLEAKAEAANERYNEASLRFNEISASVRNLKKKVNRERRALDTVLGSVDDLARATYTSGGVDTSLQILLAEDPVQFLAQAAALDQLAQSQASDLRQTQTARLRLAQTEAALRQKQSAARKVRNEMASARREARARLADAEKVLGSLQAAERRRLAAMAADERRAALAAAASAAASLGSGASGAGGGFSGGSRAMAAVRYALSQVGDRYVAAASGPSAFDCSGLTMMAWRQAGISLPHYSYSQYRRVRKIPLSQAQPGDLVFYFGGSVHHVGIYIGNGKMVHAANPRSGVLVSNILGPWYNKYFTGIGRVVG